MFAHVSRAARPVECGSRTCSASSTQHFVTVSEPKRPASGQSASRPQLFPWLLPLSGFRLAEAATKARPSLRQASPEPQLEGPSEDVEVIRAWARDPDSDIDAAARFFAIPSFAENGLTYEIEERRTLLQRLASVRRDPGVTQRRR